MKSFFVKTINSGTQTYRLITRWLMSTSDLKSSNAPFLELILYNGSTYSTTLTELALYEKYRDLRASQPGLESSEYLVITLNALTTESQACKLKAGQTNLVLEWFNVLGESGIELSQGSVTLALETNSISSHFESLLGDVSDLNSRQAELTSQMTRLQKQHDEMKSLCEKMLSQFEVKTIETSTLFKGVLNAKKDKIKKLSLRNQKLEAHCRQLVAQNEALMAKSQMKPHESDADSQFDGELSPRERERDSDSDEELPDAKRPAFESRSMELDANDTVFSLPQTQDFFQVRPPVTPYVNPKRRASSPPSARLATKPVRPIIEESTDDLFEDMFSQ